MAFKYFGHILIASDNYWPAVVANMQKAQNKWAQMLRILGSEG